MKVSPQHPTTSYGPRSKGNRSRYNLDSPPPAAHISSAPDMVGKRFGWVEIISPEKRWNEHRNHCMVLTRCTGCGATQWQNLSNLQRGVSKGCQSCSQRRAIPEWLQKRLTAAKQRCENPKDPGYPMYGGRGITFDFNSVLEAGLHMVENLGLPGRQMEIDRINTNNGYSPGNLRWATRKENQANRRISVLPDWNPKYWPYAESTVRRKLSQGLTRDEIIQEAETAVFERRKNWKGIETALKSMTYEMPESIIVTPYRGASSTTVDTEGQSVP